MQRSIIARSKASTVDLLGIISGRDLFENFLRAKGRAVLPHCTAAPRAQRNTRVVGVVQSMRNNGSTLARRLPDLLPAILI